MFSRLFNSLSATPVSGSATAYKKVNLMPSQPVDLYIHHSRGKGIWAHDNWLEEGRPRELSSLNLSTWSLLTTSIKEYQLAQRQYAARIFVRMMLPWYVLWFVGLGVLVGSNSEAADVMLSFMNILLWGMIVASALVASHLGQKYVDSTFYPAVQAVLQELEPKFIEAGYDIQLMVETGNWCGCKPSKSFLRFTPLCDEEKAASAAVGISA